MKNIDRILIGMFLLMLITNISSSQTAEYTLTARNISMPADNILEFEIYLLWTNPNDTCVFNYGSCIYALKVNPAAIAGQYWICQNIGSDLPPSLQPANISAALSMIRFAGNLPGEQYTISSTYPGTLIVKTRIQTNHPSFPIVPLNLRWHNSGPGRTRVAGTCITLIDTTKHFIEDSTFVLPVELSSFISIVNRNNVTLNWSTTRETNNEVFEIERKISTGVEWIKIGFVKGNGTTNVESRYTFSDRVSTGTYNYRLKQIDFNGNSEYYNLTNEVRIGVTTDYAITQNYPNPFNPLTKIDYNIPYDSKVLIQLYDHSGREIGKILDEVKTAGYYTLQFDASEIASGMYFYRITAIGSRETFIETKKMVLVK